MTGEIFGTLLVMLSVFAGGVLIGMMIRERHWWKKQDTERAEQIAQREQPLPEQSLPKRHFRIRTDGWVKHDGGQPLLPNATPLEMILRGVDAIYEDTASQVPDAWWQHRVGKYAVLWYRVKQMSEFRPPYPKEFSA